MANEDYNFVLLIGLIIALIVIVEPQSSSVISPYHRVCLIDHDSLYRMEDGRFRLSDVTDPSMCTHIVYGPMVVEGEAATLLLAGAYDEDNLSYLVSLKASHPNLSILLSVGGPVSGSVGFNTVLNDTETGELFAQNCVNFIRERSLDGIVIDWTPTIPEDIDGHLDNFTTLLTIISNTFRMEATQSGLPPLLISATMSGDRDTIETFYPVQALAQYADFILVKTYDFYTADLPLIGHQSSLYPRNEEEGYFTVMNLDFVIRFLLYLEVPSYKLVVGVPSHGRSLRFVNESLQYFGADHAGPGSRGPYSHQDGKLTYYEICELVSTGWVESFHEEHQTPFAFSTEEIVTYDNVQSIVNKVNYVKDNELGGLFVSSLADDDFSGTFCLQGSFPLTQTIKTTLIRTRDDCYPGEYGSVDLPGCAPCPLGSYQPKPFQSQCVPCPSGYSTLDTGAKGPKQCVVDCGSGYEYSYMSKSCDICPLGYYRNSPTHSHCYQCSVDMTTVAKGSSHCVEVPDGVRGMDNERVKVETAMKFEADSCENESLLLSAITQIVSELVLKTASVWPSLCHQECSNLNLHKSHGCTNGERGKRGSLGLQVELDNVSLSTYNGHHARLTSKVLEQALYQQESYEPLENYGVNFKGLDWISTSIVCQDGRVVVDEHCDPCAPGTFHNRSSSACQNCPPGTYQDSPEMTSCVQCEGVSSTVVSGAISAVECVSPCDARPQFCHNGGECHWTEVDPTSLYCQCFDGYSGDRCDVIADAYVDTGVIVGSSIGVVMVLLLIVLIVVAFTACIRYTKAKNRPSSRNSETSNQGQGRASNLRRSAISGKAYVVSRSSGQRFGDYLDYYNWLYLSQNYFLPPIQHPQSYAQEFKPIVTTLPNRPRYHTALPSPISSGNSKISKYNIAAEC